MLVGLGRQHPGLGHRQPEPHHRRVGGVLLVRLDRPGVVVDVEVVEDDRLLDPLAADRVPVRQPVDDHVVLDRLAQVERLDRHPLAVRSVSRSPPSLRSSFERLEQALVGDRPADVGAERQADVDGALAPCPVPPCGRDGAGAPSAGLVLAGPQHPAQPVAELVAPVVPVVAVPRALEQNIDAAFAQEACKRAVLVGEPLELAGRDEGAGRPAARGARRSARISRAMRWKTGCGRRASLRSSRMNEPDFSTSPPKTPGIAEGGGERGDRAEAGAEQHPLAPAPRRSRQRAPSAGRSSRTRKRACAPAAGVFAQPVAGLHQRRDHRRDLARVDQVVEHHRQVGVGDEVVAVVDDDQRIGAGPGRGRPAGRPARRGSRRRRALSTCELLDAAGRRAARQAPLRPLVAEGAATEFSPNGSPARAGFSGSTIQLLAAVRGRPRACTRSGRRPRPAAAAARGRCRRSRTNGRRSAPPWIQRTRCTWSASPRQAKVSVPGSASGNSCSARKPRRASPSAAGRRPASPAPGCRPRPSIGGHRDCTFMLGPCMLVARSICSSRQVTHLRRPSRRSAMPARASAT